MRLCYICFIFLVACNHLLASELFFYSKDGLYVIHVQESGITKQEKLLDRSDLDLKFEVSLIYNGNGVLTLSGSTNDGLISVFYDVYEHEILGIIKGWNAVIIDNYVYYFKSNSETGLFDYYKNRIDSNYNIVDSDILVHSGVYPRYVNVFDGNIVFYDDNKGDSYMSSYQKIRKIQFCAGRTYIAGMLSNDCYVLSDLKKGQYHTVFYNPITDKLSDKRYFKSGDEIPIAAAFDFVVLLHVKFDIFIGENVESWLINDTTGERILLTDKFIARESIAIVY